MDNLREQFNSFIEAVEAYRTKLELDYQTKIETLGKETRNKADLDAKHSELMRKEAELDTRDKELNERSQALEDRALILDKKEENLSREKERVQGILNNI